MTGNGLSQLASLRARVFEQIARVLAEDGHCKSYEGQFSVIIPHYFQQREQALDAWTITLDLYVFGPSRHYRWTGATFGEALRKCEADVTVWIQESQDALREELLP
jgi:hypothetical protein